MNRVLLPLDLLRGDGQIRGGSISPKASWKNEIWTLQGALHHIQTRERRGKILTRSGGPSKETRQWLNLGVPA